MHNLVRLPSFPPLFTNEITIVSKFLSNRIPRSINIDCYKLLQTTFQILIFNERLQAHSFASKFINNRMVRKKKDGQIFRTSILGNELERDAVDGYVRSNGTGYETIPWWTVAMGWRTVARALARASNEPASPPYRRVSNTQTGTRTGFTYKRGDVNISADLQTAAADNANRLPHGAPATCPPCQWQPRGPIKVSGP